MGFRVGFSRLLQFAFMLRGELFPWAWIQYRDEPARIIIGLFCSHVGPLQCSLRVTIPLFIPQERGETIAKSERIS